MIIDFTVGNFLSFRERVTLSLEASSASELEPTNVFRAGDLRLLRAAVVYGANASGKSNLIKAMTFMKRLTVTSSKETQIGDEIDVTPFRLSEDGGKPSYFELRFIRDKTRYRYGFEVSRKRVHREWLYSQVTSKEANLFTRDAGGISVNRNRFKGGRDLTNKTRTNALFLSVAAQFNQQIARQLVSWFKGLRFISGATDMAFLPYTLERLEDEKCKKRILEMVRNVDLGIDDISGKSIKVTADRLPKDMPAGLKKQFVALKGETLEIRTVHRRLSGDKVASSVEFDLESDESEGTRKFVAMTGPLIDTLDNGYVLVIDELDARMHPLVTRYIISLFNSRMNRCNAQLIFATHDTNLLSSDYMRRDQIWFTEKRDDGSTSLYSLIEFKAPSTGKRVRKDASFRKDYIQGRYGAIPFIGDFNLLAGTKPC
jgi:AAA15 family ATPase/GTPase